MLGMNSRTIIENALAQTNGSDIVKRIKKAFPLFKAHNDGSLWIKGKHKHRRAKPYMPPAVTENDVDGFENYTAASMIESIIEEEKQPNVLFLMNTKKINQ